VGDGRALDDYQRRRVVVRHVAPRPIVNHILPSRAGVAEVSDSAARGAVTPA